ncbi:hypothetical protein N7G274_008173 [Stereocaulon virgatum]|uniref:Hypercellular protein HypA n=1 Tax=Stereocaulon virgatum TaxID=373712 RepID=A0ABR4A309_9LECA
MDLDPLSVITPARVKVLLLPIGHVRQSRFEGFVARLQRVNVVRLGDVSPDSRPHRTMFSPLAFPEGLVLYDLSTTLSPPSHSALAPFEIHREPLVVVGIADGKGLGADVAKENQSRRETESSSGMEEHVSNSNATESLSRDLHDIQREYSRALVHQLLVFDHDFSPLPKGIHPVPSPERSRTTTVKTVMCDLTSRLLAEMTTYAKSMQALPTLESPRVPTGSAVLNGSVSALPAHMVGSSRPGSVVENPRSFSPVDDRPNPSHRMSMPAHMPSGPVSRSSTPDSRATSPPNGVRTPPTTFNEINGSSPSQSPPKSLSHMTSRAGSRDRVSANGIGAGSLGERERNKGKGRIGVVVGAMYLLAGRWPDAVKELVQSATIARGNSDYVWHAKAMDYILVCLLMYAWAGMDFRIPDIFFPNVEKLKAGASIKSTHSPSNSLPELTGRKSLDPADRAANLRTLTGLLPDLTNNILNLYSRAWTFTDDKISPLSFSQSAIRFAKLLSAIHLSNGSLDDVLLRHIVLNADIPQDQGPPPESTPFLSKGELVGLLFRAYPRPISESLLSIADYTAILAGIASVLSELGYHRKKALVLKELLFGLLPALVQARKDAAAEMGVHPAASLASLHGTAKAIPLDYTSVTSDDSEQGMQHLLALICHAYGIRSPKAADDHSSMMAPIRKEKSSLPSSTPTAGPSTEAVVARIVEQASAKLFGFQDLKINVLRSCINICEALPDLSGALRYSADLLRVAGSGIAPGPDNSDGSPDLPIEEQVQLANNISRTLSAARQLGIEHPEAEYWDEFLVRGIEIMDASQPKSLMQHAKSELEIVETMNAKTERDPFIYNSFIKSKASTVAEPLLVAHEEAAFRVTLQNLYDFDLVIERLRLESDGVPFECSAQATMIGPYRTQTLLLSGTPQSGGSLTVRGCTAKIRGCRERSFTTFSEPWALKPNVKGRHMQSTSKLRPGSNTSDSTKGKTYRPPKGPTTMTLALNVISAQPNVALKSISLPQSTMMLLEGETKKFTITLQNTSLTTPADLLLLSFDDSLASQRQSALLNKELSAVELYELEHAIAHKQSFRWLRKDKDKDLKLSPGEETMLEIKVLGKPGLSYGTIQVDYGYLGVPRAEIKDHFFTRQLVIPITVTVNTSIDLIRNDTVTLPTDLSWPKESQGVQDSHENEDSTVQKPSTSTIDLKPLLNLISHPSTPRPHALFLLDLRNSWPNTLTLTLTLSSPSSPSTNSQSSTYKLTLSPSKIHRIPLPLPRLYLPNAYVPIPSLNPANKRQFVVSATKISPEVERAMREAFWYREAVLERVSATWREESTGRNGVVDLRGISLTPQMVSSVKLEDLDIQMSVTNTEPGAGEGAVKQLAPSKFSVPTCIFLTLITTLYNRSSSPIHPLLRLQPSLADQPQNIALDLSKRLLVNGVLQRAIPTLGPGERKEVETGFCVLSAGVYEWGATVEEVRASGKAAERKGRGRAATGDFDVLADMGRRLWHAEERCVVVARDEEEDGERDCGEQK